MATLFVVVVTLSVPFTPLGKMFGLSQLPMAFPLLIGIIVILYIITAEMVKTVFYKKVKL
jgi:Mg2+-importing ATPase